MKLLDIYLYLFIILFGNNLIQDSYLALIKPYWQIIITSYRLVLQVLCGVCGKFQLPSKRQEPFVYGCVVKQLDVVGPHLCDICSEIDLDTPSENNQLGAEMYQPERQRSLPLRGVARG
jgi:hypothetical protein